MKLNLILSFILVSTMNSGCRTLDRKAKFVRVLDKVESSCEKLGLVHVDWTWWGSTTETVNSMKNQVAIKGGNTLLLTGDATGFAYQCP